MRLLVIFTSEEEGSNEILKILAEKGVEKGVVLESQGMRKVLGGIAYADKIFGLREKKRPFNKTILAIIEKEEVEEISRAVNDLWKPDRNKGKKENRVMFSVPIDNLTVGLSC